MQCLEGKTNISDFVPRVGLYPFDQVVGIHNLDGRNPAPVGSWFIPFQSPYLQCFIASIRSISSYFHC
jgi:hypothetical protein